MTALGSAFLIVKKFDGLYRSYGYRTPRGTQIYSLPQEGIEPDAVRKKYRGLDREPLTGLPLDSLARMLRLNAAAAPIAERTATLAMAQLSVARGVQEDHLLPSFEDARDVYLTLGEPKDWEIVWAQLTGESGQAPPQSVRLGCEPSWYPGGYFSALCDCMCFPRWHGTDEAGTLFADYHARLNAHGLFESQHDAAEFLRFYLSLDWTETGEYSIVEVYALSDAFYECLQHPVVYAVTATLNEPLAGSLPGMTWNIHLERVAKDRKISGIKALRDITNMGLAEAKAVVEGLPKVVAVVHLGDVEILKQRLLEGGFDFQISAHG
jgi:large subunit ribosomal protein L7/L12